MVRSCVLFVVLLLAAPAAAQAQAPPNDARKTPQRLDVPATVPGTTRGSTLEADEPGSCAPLRGSVFYEVAAKDSSRIVIRLQAAGDLDAVLDVFRRTRSQLEPVDCDVGDAQGRAQLTFQPAPDAIYLIRVGQRANSVEGDFRLDVFAPQPPPRPPGRPLPARGVTRALDAVQNTSDAWSRVLRAGTTYRLNFATIANGCASVAVYPPRTRSFEQAPPVRRVTCGGYRLFTPAAGEGGRYSFVVSAQPRRRGDQRYHLQIDRALTDDTGPGLPLGNFVPRRGSLRGGRIDAVDLYRFTIAERSDLRLTLRGGFTMQLVGDAGRRLARSDDGEIRLQVSRGRYFVAVRARADQSGRYTLLRATRTITTASVRVGGADATRVPLGRTVTVAVSVDPEVSGRAAVTIERFDPLAGWQFHRLVSVPVAAGTGRYAFTPPSVGRWRVNAAFVGTRTAAPSETGYVDVVVDEP